MKITSRERVGLRAMAELARHYGEGPIPLSQVAEVQDLPLPYLEQVAASLRRSGLLESTRGAHGGYTLARKPEHITVGDILRAVEGSLFSLDCMRDDACCARQPLCAARSVWESVLVRLHETLDSMSLADITNDIHDSIFSRED